MINQEMDIEEDEDDDYGLYIEELKSENPNLKFNAAQKIVSVSKVLGIVIYPQFLRFELNCL